MLGKTQIKDIVVSTLSMHIFNIIIIVYSLYNNQIVILLISILKALAGQTIEPAPHRHAVSRARKSPWSYKQYNGKH